MTPKKVFVVVFLYQSDSSLSFLIYEATQWTINGNIHVFRVYGLSHPTRFFISDFEELLFDSMDKKLNEFHKRFTRFKKVTPQTKEKEDIKKRFRQSWGSFR